MPVSLKKEWIKLATGKKRLEIASNKIPHLLQLLLEYRERLEYEFSNLRAEELYSGKVNISKGDSHNKDESMKAKCWQSSHMALSSI